jgi:hypothetical protein
MRKKIIQKSSEKDEGSPSGSGEWHTEKEHQEHQAARRPCRDHRISATSTAPV